jgi:AcrR family transcriptional regulator
MTSEERRACIVRASCRLFAEKGFRGTTTRELASAVGVTEPVLYEHFKTKRELYSAIIEEKARAGNAFFAELREEYAGSTDDVRFFTTLGQGIIEWYTADPDFIRLLLFSTLEGHELKDLFYERTALCFSAVAEYIAKRIEAGAMRGTDPVLAARSFFGMVAHYALTGLVFGFQPLNRNTKEVVSEMVSIFLGGMYAQEQR